MKLLLFLKILMMPLNYCESLSILNYCLENYDANYYITDHPERISPPKEETNVLQDSMEEEIVEPESSLDEKEEESDEQKEEEWSHPCLPSNESTSLNLTLYECYDPMDSFEISLLMKLMPSMLMAVMP